MKRFNSFLFLKEFNKVYQDLDFVDFYDINQITDTRVRITIYTKVLVRKEDELFDTLVERNELLGSILNREILWNVQLSKNFSGFPYFKRLIYNFRRNSRA